MKRGKRVFRFFVLLALFLFGITGFAYALSPSNSTVEGQGNYFVTGESYPTNIVVAGYNARDQIVYLNIELETTKTVNAGETATFNYFTEVYNDSASKIGNAGTVDVTETASGELAATTAQVTNKAITVTSPLSTEYRIIVTVKSVSIA